MEMLKDSVTGYQNENPDEQNIHHYCRSAIFYIISGIGRAP